MSTHRLRRLGAGCGQKMTTTAGLKPRSLSRIPSVCAAGRRTSLFTVPFTTSSLQRPLRGLAPPAAKAGASCPVPGPLAPASLRGGGFAPGRNRGAGAPLNPAQILLPQNQPGGCPSGCWQDFFDRLPRIEDVASLGHSTTPCRVRPPIRGVHKTTGVVLPSLCRRHVGRFAGRNSPRSDGACEAGPVGAAIGAGALVDTWSSRQRRPVGIQDCFFLAVAFPSCFCHHRWRILSRKSR